MTNARRAPALVAVALILITFVVYGRVGSYEFVRFDDGEYVFDNPAVSAGLSWEGVRWAFSAYHSSNWHPLTWLSHQLDCELFGLDAGRHHLVNVVLHALNAVLLFTFLLRATRRLWPSAFVAAAFALHPLRVQSVAWVSERKDLLVALFFFLGLLAYLRYARRPSIAAYLGVLLAFVLALLAKPSAVTFPFLLLLLDVWPLGRMRGETRTGLGRLVAEKLPLALLIVGSAALTIAAQRASGALGSLEVVPLGARLANAISSYGIYAAKTVMPTDLAFFYPHPAIVSPGWGWASLDVVGGALLLAIVSLVAVRMRDERPWFLVGWFWFVGMLVPMIGLVQVGEQAYADRYAYLSTIGIYIAVAFTVQRSLAPALGLALAACALTSALETTYWRDSRALFEHALETTEHNYVAETGLANVLRAEGRESEARRHYRRALRVRPSYPAALFGSGLIEHEAGNFELAAELYARARDQDPSLVRAHLNLGAVLGELGRTSAAIDAFGEALALDPKEPSARANLEELARQFRALVEEGNDDPELRRLLARTENLLRGRAPEAPRD